MDAEAFIVDVVRWTISSAIAFFVVVILLDFPAESAAVGTFMGNVIAEFIRLREQRRAEE